MIYAMLLVRQTSIGNAMKVLVPVKRVVDFNVKVRDAVVGSSVACSG